MKTVAMFKKVSYEQFKKDMIACYPDMANHEENIQNIYDEIKMPKRATEGSAGYDFHIPFTGFVDKKVDLTIPTGIRCIMEPGWVLMLFPRSGLGFKYGVALKNTVGIVDSDYANAENEGHIMVKLTADQNKVLEADSAFAQGIFLPFGITVDDEADGVRTGGFGSTDKQEG